MDITTNRYVSGEEILVGDLVQLIVNIKEMSFPVGQLGLVIERADFNYQPNIEVDWGDGSSWNMYNRELKFIRRDGKKWLTWT